MRIHQDRITRCKTRSWGRITKRRIFTACGKWVTEIEFDSVSCVLISGSWQKAMLLARMVSYGDIDMAMECADWHRFSS